MVFTLHLIAHELTLCNNSYVLNDWDYFSNDMVTILPENTTLREDIPKQ